jgi:hypothetical protein
MDERTTGATDAHIEAAVRRGWWPDDSRDDVQRQIMTGYAEDLVPPDHRIFGPDDIAALRFAERVLSDVIDTASNGDELCHEVLAQSFNAVGGDADVADYETHRARLAALIGDDGNG